MALESQHAEASVLTQASRDQWEFLQYCYEEAHRSVELLQLQPVSTLDLAPGEAIQLLVLAGGRNVEVYGQRLVFVQVTKEADGNLTWLSAVRSFTPDQFSLTSAAETCVPQSAALFAPLFDPDVLASIAVPEALQESVHVDEVTKRSFWRIVTFGQHDMPVFCGAASFLSGEYMLAGLGSLDASGKLQRSLVPDRDVSFPGELYIGSEIFPRRWPKPVRAFIDGVFGEDRSDEMPLGMRRAFTP